MWNPKKPELIETENRLVVSKGGRKMGEGGKGYTLPVMRQISSGVLMYSTVTIINNTVLYI